MKSSKTIFIFLFISILLTSTVFGQTKEAEKKDTQKQAAAAGIPQGVKEMKREDLIKEIKFTLDASKDSIRAVPGLEMVKDEKGAANYLFKDKDGKMIKLEDVDKETLEFIFVKVRNERARISNEQTMKQMKEIKRIQDMNRQNALMRSLNQQRTTTTYKPSYNPPQVPKATTTQPKLPRTTR